LMSALMTDLLNGSITPGIGNATCNAGGKLLKGAHCRERQEDRSAERPRARAAADRQR
jgi:hypothetical protein